MNDFILQRKQEFILLLADKNYTNILFDESTGALQATHIEHHFDTNKGYYEKQVQKILFVNGNKIILESEKKAPGIKTPDGTLNDVLFEIKAVEGNGKNNIKNKFNQAVSQGCKHIVLFFPDTTLYNQNIINEGYIKYKGVLKREDREDEL